MRERNVQYFETVSRKIDEYYLYLLNRGASPGGFWWDAETGKETPILRFRIGAVLERLRASGKEQEFICKIGMKLLDIKLLLCYLRTASDVFHLGATLIVGMDEIEKLNPKTISLLRCNQYRVFLIATLTESILDLLQLYFLRKIRDHKKNKWERVFQEVKPYGAADLFPDAGSERLLRFKEEYRTSEFHKSSKVRSFISKDKWDHFQDEEQVLTETLVRIHSRMLS